jgi:hypothetical protein
MRVQMTSIFLKNIKETLVTEKPNNTLQVTLDPLCTFTTAKAAIAPKHLGVGVRERFWPISACRERLKSTQSCLSREAETCPKLTVATGRDRPKTANRTRLGK